MRYMPIEMDDKKIIENFLAGDEQAFSVLVKKYLDNL